MNNYKGIVIHRYYNVIPIKLPKISETKSWFFEKIKLTNL